MSGREHGLEIQEEGDGKNMWKSGRQNDFQVLSGSHMSGEAKWEKTKWKRWFVNKKIFGKWGKSNFQTSHSSVVQLLPTKPWVQSPAPLQNKKQNKKKTNKSQFPYSSYTGSIRRRIKVEVRLCKNTTRAKK
jgi:hypothetical protein